MFSEASCSTSLNLNFLFSRMGNTFYPVVGDHDVKTVAEAGIQTHFPEWHSSCDDDKSDCVVPRDEMPVVMTLMMMTVRTMMMMEYWCSS